MVRLNLSCFDEFTARFIRAKARQLIRCPGFTRSDYDELVQDFAINLDRRKSKFDPTKATWQGFAIVVCQNHFANLLEHHSAEKRSHKREAGSLNRPIKDDEGKRTEMGTTIPEFQPARRTGQYRRSRKEASDLIPDVAHVLEQLPLRLRPIAERLQQASKEDVARELGVSSKTIYRRVAEIRQRFEHAGMRAYL